MLTVSFPFQESLGTYNCFSIFWMPYHWFETSCCWGTPPSMTPRPPCRTTWRVRSASSRSCHFAASGVCCKWMLLGDVHPLIQNYRMFSNLATPQRKLASSYYKNLHEWHTHQHQHDYWSTVMMLLLLVDVGSQRTTFQCFLLTLPRVNRHMIYIYTYLEPDLFDLPRKLYCSILTHRHLYFSFSGPLKCRLDTKPLKFSAL